MSGRLNSYLADIEEQAQERFERILEQMKQAQNDILDEQYMNVALQYAEEDDLCPLGQYIYYDALDTKRAWLETALEEGVEIHESDSLEDCSGQLN